MAYGDFKDLPKKTAAGKVLRDKAFNIAKNPNMMDINVDLLQWSINFVIKRLLVVVLKRKMCQTSILQTYLKNYINQLIKNLKNEKCIHLL